MTSNIVLSVKDLKKVYPGKDARPAVDSISFQLKKGEILGLLGPNGSGKTTTIQMLLGTLSYTEGSIVYFDKPFPKYRSEILQSVSFASTYTSLPWILTLEENLVVFGALYGLSKAESTQKFDPLLKRFGIYDKKYQKVSALSAGQVTRLMLVKAFFTEPKIVLLDEPTASLDPDIAKDICAFLLEQREKMGVSILFSSHRMDEVMEICDRTIFLKEGKIIADDVPQKLARSVSSYRVRLVIVDGLEKTKAMVENMSLHYSFDHKIFEIHVEEEKIPILLNTLSQQNVRYANIQIEEPSLEDFFLQIAKRSKNEF